MRPLNPIMAAFLVASAAALPPRAAFAEKIAQPTVKEQPANEDDPIHRLERLIKDKDNASARADMGGRLERFLLEPGPDGRSYVDGGVDKAALGAIARAWPELVALGKQDPEHPEKNVPPNPTRVATLYFVVGPEASIPIWAQNDPILSKTLKPGMKWQGRLRNLLDRWTKEARITKATESQQAGAFLEEAADEAKKVFDDPRTQQEVEISIGVHDTTAVVVPGMTGTSPAPLSAARAFSFTDLYVGGAIVAKIYGPDDDQHALISVRIRTVPGPDGQPVNMIGVCDITDSNTPLCRKFPFGANEEFILDDRDSKNWKYSLKVTTGKNGRRELFFGRPGSKPGDGAISTSIEELLLKRADQAALLGNIVSFGGQDFYVSPQGGGTAAVSFLPKELVDDRSMENASELRPTCYADVGRRDSEGRTANIPGKPWMYCAAGFAPHHMEFNGKTKLWEVKEGEGDKPPAPPTPTPAPGGNAGGGGAGGGPTTHGTEEDDADGDSPLLGATQAALAALDRKEEEIVAKEGWQRDASLTDKLDADLKRIIRILRKTVSGSAQFKLLFPLSERTVGTLEYRSKDSLKIERVHGWKHYLLVDTSEQWQYRDLAKPDEDDGFKLAGLVSYKQLAQTGGGQRPQQRGKVAAGFTSWEAFAHALERHFGFEAGHAIFTELPKRAREAAGGKSYGWEADGRGENFGVHLRFSEDSKRTIWPKLEPEGGSASPAPGGAHTPTNVMEPVTSVEDLAFHPSFVVPGTADEAKLIKEQNGAAIYETQSGPKKYFLFFRYKTKDGKDVQGKDVIKTLKSISWVAFDESKQFPAPPSGYAMQGLAEEGKLVENDNVMGVGALPGNDAKRGVLAAYQRLSLAESPEENLRDKAAKNCAGPVLWWGLASRQAALAACEANKLP